MCIKINKIGKQEVGIWWVQKRFPRYGVPIWSLWPNIRFLPSIVAEKNEHICSMYKNQQSRQTGNFSTISWREQVAYQQWGVLCTRLIQLVGFLMLAHCNKSTGRHITPIWHISLILSQPVFAFTLSVACLEEKQPIPILYGPTPTITQLIQFMTVW